MTNHARFETSPAQEVAENNSRIAYLAERGVLVRQVTYDQAVNAAAIARRYPTMNPNLAGPIMIQGIPYDSPAIHTIALMDQRQIDEDGWINAGINFAQGATRGLFVGLEVGTAALQQAGNTVVRMMRGESFGEAQAASGSSILGEMLQQWRLHPDRPINLGSGWLPESEMPWETEGFSDRFRENFAEYGDKTPATLEESFRLTVDEALQEYGAPITQRARTEQFSTPIRRTMRDGRTYISNFSPINAAMNPLVGLQTPGGHTILEPDDALYQTISTIGQFVTDVTFDPWNVPLVALPRMAQTRRFLPQQMTNVEMSGLAGSRAKRHWYNPVNGNDWLINSEQGQKLVQYLTNNRRFSETMRVLDLGDAEYIDDAGKLVSPGKVWDEITEATDTDVVTELLMPHLGTRITEMPKAHLGPSPTRPVQTIRSALSRSYKGPEGYTTRIDSLVAKPFIRWGAKMTRGIFDGNDIATSLHVAHNYMKMLNVPAEQMDEVLKLIARTGDTNFEMANAGKKLKTVVSEVLTELHGADKADIEALWGRWDKLNDAVKAYHTDNLGWQVRGRGTRMKAGPGLVEDVPDIRPFTPEEIAPGGRMRTDELIGARKKAGPADRKFKTAVVGLQERAMGGSSYVISHGRKDWLVEKVGNKWTNSTRDTAGNLNTYKTKKAAIAAIEEGLPKEAQVFGELGRSIADDGVQVPVKVEFNPKSGQYRVVDGNKRVLAADAAGIDDVPVEIIERDIRFVADSKEKAAVRKNTLKTKGLSQGTKEVRSAGADIPAVDPMLAAEYAGDIYILPDQRDMRRMTSWLRKIRRGLHGVDPERAVGEGELVWGKMPMHQQAAYGMLLDTGMSRWREWQLMAVRWTMNVIPDELFRLSASGYASPAYHPGQYMMWTIGGRGELSLTGDRFADILSASDYGAGYTQSLTEVAQHGFVGDIRTVPWVPFEVGQAGHYDAWATKIIHQWADPFSRKSLSMSRDDAFIYFTTPGEGLDLLKEIVKGARNDTKLSKLISEPRVLVDHIAEVEARAHQYAGGTWRGLDVSPGKPKGTWTDSNDNIVSAPDQWNPRDGNWIITQKGDENILDIIKTGQVKTGRTYVDQAGKTVEATKPVLWKGGEPGRRGRPASLATERATRRQGRKQVEGLKDQLKKSKAEWKTLEEGGTVAPAAPHTIRGQDPKLAKRMDGIYVEFVDNVFAVLGQAPSMVLSRSPFFRQKYWREMARGYVNATPELRMKIRVQAKKSGVVEFDNWVRDELQMAGYKVPKKPTKDVRTAPSMETMKTDEWDALADNDLVTVFHVTTEENAEAFLRSGVKGSDKTSFDPDAAKKLGQEPYNAGEGLYVGSRPEQLAEMYGTTPGGGYSRVAAKRGKAERVGTATLEITVPKKSIELGPEMAGTKRSLINELADKRLGAVVKGDIPASSIRRTKTSPTDIEGLPVMPKGKGWDDMEDLDDWGRAVGLSATKNLLYDLSESHNIVDMTRNIFVFAEAWWEIISRWSNMLFNPQTRSFYNWEKARQIGEFAQQQGFMSDNEFGQTVFNWPSLGLSILGEQGGDQGKTRLGTEISLGQLISNPLSQLGSGEPGAIRSIMGPGFGPLIQILAPPFQKMLPVEWQQMFQITVTGEFPLAESMWKQGFNSLPSSFKNAATLIDTDLGMTERRFNNNIATYLETLTTSGAYDMEDPAQHRQLEKDAVTGGLTLTVARLFDSLFSPESPRYVPELLVDSIKFGQNHYIDAAAIGAALDFAEVLFNDPKAALAYIGDVYGIDPMDLLGIDLPKSRVIKQRPVTNTAFIDMQNNAEFYEEFQFTAYAFWPDDPDEDFMTRAWNDQLSNDTTVSLSNEEQVSVFSFRQASLKYDISQTRALQQSIVQTRTNPLRRTAIEQDWRDWLFARRMDIESEHPGWSRSVFGIDAHFEPGPATPEPGDLHQDFLNMVVRDNNGVIVDVKPHVRAANPEVAEFVKGMMATMDEAHNDSVARGNQPHTWMGSTAAWAVAWQTSISEKARRYINAVRATGKSTVGMEWIVRRWLDPALQGVDMGTPFITDSALATAPVYRADDRITTP